MASYGMPDSKKNKDCKKFAEEILMKFCIVTWIYNKIYNKRIKEQFLDQGESWSS